MLRPTLLATLLFVLPAVAMATATSQEVPAQAPITQKARPTKAQEHIITLQNGQTLRVKAKLENGQWLLRMGRDWKPIPESFVAQATTVKALLKQAKQLESELKLKSADDRVKLASWLADHGLHNEALAHIDTNLRKNPDHVLSLALLARGVIPMNLSRHLPATPPAADATEATWLAATIELLDQLVVLSPATREIGWHQVATQFATPENSSKLLSAATSSLSSPKSARRQMAAACIHRLVLDQAGETTVLGLVQRAALDGSEAVRHQAARALRDMGDASVNAPFIKALGSKSMAIRANASDALGIIASRAAAPALVAALAATSSASGDDYTPPASSLFFGNQMAYIQDYDVEGFSFQVAADPQINVITEGVVLDVRLLSAHSRSVQTGRSRLRSSLRNSLGQITGQDFRLNHTKWESWLAENPVNSSSSK